MVTLDGYKYTFNGHGEFVLVQSLDSSLNIQARMTELHIGNTNNRSLSGSGTVITAIVAKHKESNTVQFESFNNTLVALVNGDEIDFSELSNQQFINLTVSNKGNLTYTASLSTRAIITVKYSNNFISDIAVTLSDEYYDSVVGLLGQYNSKNDDDLIPQNGNTSISINSTLEEIHYKFGMTCKQIMFVVNV